MKNGQDMTIDYDVLSPWMQYSKYNKMLHISYTTYLKNEDGDSLTFDWEDFIEDAKGRLDVTLMTKSYRI